MLDEIGGGEKWEGALKLRGGFWSCCNWMLNEDVLAKKVSVIPTSKQQQQKATLKAKKLREYSLAMKNFRYKAMLCWSLLFSMVMGENKNGREFVLQVWVKILYWVFNTMGQTKNVLGGEH